MLLELGVLGEGFGADVGGEELGVALLQAEVLRGSVAEEVFRVGGDVGADGGHARLIGCVV